MSELLFQITAGAKLDINVYFFNNFYRYVPFFWCITHCFLLIGGCGAEVRVIMDESYTCLKLQICKIFLYLNIPNSGLVISAESLVVQRTTTFSKCGCPPDFLVVRMPLLRAAPS